MFLANLIKPQLKTNKEKVKILFLGLSNAGKSSLLKYIVTKEFDNKTDMTMGINIGSFTSNKISFDCIDLAGQKTFRSLWYPYISFSNAIVFVIDSVNFADFEEAKQEFLSVVSKLLENDKKNIPILLLATKSDLKESLSESYISTYFLDVIREKNFQFSNFFKISAKTGENIDNALKWLGKSLEK